MARERKALNSESSRFQDRSIAALIVIAAISSLTLAACSSEQIDRSASGVEEQWVVSLGDSYISGEAGRWAGNQAPSSQSIDALSTDAYTDAADGEAFIGCHRSKSAAIHIGDVNSVNLACSGATTSSQLNPNGAFKPGIDFFQENGDKGQALMLQEFAEAHQVKLVALSIGGNDFGFSAIVKACLMSFMKPEAYGANCKDSPSVQSLLSPQAADVVRQNTTQAILNIASAMENAGYTDSEWTLGLQLYPNVLADPKAMRYPDTGFDRFLVGGCAFRDPDAAWAGNTVVPLMNATFQQAAADAQEQRPTLQVITVDTTEALADRTLCNASVHRVGDANGAQSWKDPNAADLSEWVLEVNGDVYQQEVFHPNYWGQLALRSCWRQAWNGGDVRGGSCVRAENGLNSRGEPIMSLK